MSEHDEQAERLEREVSDMERQAKRLEGDIQQTRADWQGKQADAGVPGAVDGREPEGPETEDGAPPASGDASD